MYSMILDSVRERSFDNLLSAEVSIMRAALLGNPIVLSPNQAMDSLAIQEIILANNSTEAKTNYFCEAIKRGIIIVSKPEGCRDLIDYCISSLERGIDNEENEFVISGLPFLSEKDENGNDRYPFAQRRLLVRYIIDRLFSSNDAYQTYTPPSWLSEEQKDEVEQYIESIILLNQSVGRKYIRYSSRKQLFPEVLMRILNNRKALEKPDSELAVLIGSFTRFFGEGKTAPIYRSVYYHVLASMSGSFSKEAINEVKESIDIAYNRVMAISLETGSETYVPVDMDQLAGSIIDEEKPDFSFQSSYEETTDTGLNWEMVVWMYDEITNLLEEKDKYNDESWKEALYRFEARERNLPIRLSGKFFGFSFMNVAVSSLFPVPTFILNTFFGIAQNEVQAFAESKFGVPGSLKQTRERIKKANSAVHLLDTVIFTDNKNDKRRITK